MSCCDCIPVKLCVDPDSLPCGNGGKSFNLVTDGPEVAIPGKFWEGKQVYAKRFNFGAMPNKGAKSIRHNLINMKEYCIDYGQGWVAEGSTRYGLNHSAYVEYAWAFSITDLEIRCKTYFNQSTKSAVVVVLFTKRDD